MNRNVITFKQSTESAMKKLKLAMERLDVKDFDYGNASSRDDASAWVSFKYKGTTYKFEYSRSKALYYGKTVGKNADILIAIILAIGDLARIAERGIFDFGQLIQGFKSLEYIEVPKWASFMGFNTRPMNFAMVKDRFNDLVKGAMNPNTNADDYRQLQDYMKIAKQYFGVSTQ